MKITDLSLGDAAMIEASIKILKAISYCNSEEKGFWETYDTIATLNIPEIYSVKNELLEAIKAQKIALMHSELSEKLEGIRKPQPDSHCPEFTSEEIEAADLFIRLLDYAEKHELRFIEAVFAKMHYNATRPHRHGKAF